MKNKRKKKTYKDKKGREFIKEFYLIGGKRKSRRIYVIDGIPADEFYEQNATDLEFFMNGDYELMSSERDAANLTEDDKNKGAKPHDEEGCSDLPF